MGRLAKNLGVSIEPDAHGLIFQPLTEHRQAYTVLAMGTVKSLSGRERPARRPVGTVRLANQGVTWVALPVAGAVEGVDFSGKTRTAAVLRMLRDVGR